MDVVSEVQRRVARSLAEAGAGVVGVACSGGADSLVLADATITVLGPSAVGILHVDHGLRPTSASDAARVTAWAAAAGAACHVERVIVAPEASLENAARRVRYQALGNLARRFGLRWVLTAHTARDQAETVLMRILRGTGPAGLAGIPPRRGRYLRPLLETTRDEVDAYVAARGLPVLDDPMNEDMRFARARLRGHILPGLRAENPRVDEALCRLAASAREWASAIEAASAELLARAGAGGGGGTVELDCELLAQAPAAVTKHALSSAAAAVGLSLEAVHIEAIFAMVLGPRAGSRSIDVPDGVAVREYDRLRFFGHDVASQPEPSLHLAVDGPDGPYDVRRWAPGDRMCPARLGGRSRKLSDLFTDSRVPRAMRAHARVVVRRSDGVIVWAEHIGPAHEAIVDVRPVSAGSA